MYQSSLLRCEVAEHEAGDDGQSDDRTDEGQPGADLGHDVTPHHQSSNVVTNVVEEKAGDRDEVNVLPDSTMVLVSGLDQYGEGWAGIIFLNFLC